MFPHSSYHTSSHSSPHIVRHTLPLISSHSSSCFLTFPHAQFLHKPTFFHFSPSHWAFQLHGWLLPAPHASALKLRVKLPWPPRLKAVSLGRHSHSPSFSFMKRIPIRNYFFLCPRLYISVPHCAVAPEGLCCSGTAPSSALARCVCLRGAQTKEHSYDRDLHRRTGAKGAPCFQPPALPWRKIPPPRTEESSLPCWAQSPGKEKTESEDLGRAWGHEACGEETTGRLQRTKEQERPEHVPGVHPPSPGHRWPPGSRRAKRQRDLSGSFTPNNLRRVGPRKIRPSLNKGLGVLSGQHW